MKKSIIIGAMLAVGLAASAQVARVKSTQPLLQGVESEMYHPRLSPDGSMLLFSSVNYKGLKLYDFNDGVTTRISDEPRAGFDAQFTTDGIRYEVKKQGEYGKNAYASRSRALGKKVKPVSGVSVRTEGSVLYITRKGVEKAYTPVESYAGYIWESLSPDGTKVMFVAAGKGVVITDLEGRILSQPGMYEAPVWLGNNAIAAMKSTDDGHQFSSSQIVAMDLNGGNLTELTRPESMAMYPTATAAGDKLVYNTIDGRLILMNLELLK
ncbi:MAG: hypothetical protein HDS58_03835 [Barnesiella sp.]|nr:hypothetical protein [Barnesiella sp.]MDE6081269.1 hypothetical protein [Muribaculaceae bacterium]